MVGDTHPFQIIVFNYTIMNEEFENVKVWAVMLKFLTLTTFLVRVKSTQIQIWIFWFAKH